MKQIINFIKEIIEDYKKDSEFRQSINQTIKISIISGGTAGFIMGFASYFIRLYLNS